MKRKVFLSPEVIWDAVLSRESMRILSTWHELNPDERTSLLAHLERMVSEGGWHPEQVISARCALDAIQATTPGVTNGRKDPQ